MKKIFDTLYNLVKTFNETLKVVFIGGFLGLFGVGWVFIVGTTIERIKVYDTDTIIQVLSLIGITVGVSVAIWKLVHDHKWRRSEVYLEQAKELFDKSYSTLRLDPTTDYPINDRYTWLSSSRLLLAAIELGEKIEDVSHKETFNEYIEFWRMKFIELLDFDGKKTPPEDYFYEEGALHGYTTGQRAPLAGKSIAVIYRFMQWPEGKDDRLQHKQDFTESEINRMEIFGSKGLAKYCNKLRRKD